MSNSGTLCAPVTYQGGKSRLSKAISKLIQLPASAVFCDLCCGSGAVSLAIVEAGLPPDRLIMLDKGPWGDFWRTIGDGSFDCDRLESIIAELPSAEGIKEKLGEMALRPVDGDSVYIFLLLQAGSFGGKAIGQCNGKWVTHGFRSLWMPKEGCNRKSHVNPMMPMPDTILARVREISRRCRGATGLTMDVADFVTPAQAVVYVDPPYEGTTDYVGGQLDILAVAEGLECPCYISEAKPIGDCSLLLSSGRQKGGISGKRSTKANEEWLSAFNTHMRITT